MLNKTRPDFSQVLHEANSNPYSLGPLHGKGLNRQGTFHLAANNDYYLTISSLSIDMSETIESLRPFIHPAHLFRLGSADCRWLSMQQTAEKQYTDLLNTNAPDRFTLNFASPTCFRSQGVSMLYPTPELIFPSLLERWNRHSPLPLVIKQGNLPFISKYNLNTRLVQFAQYRMTGFTGSVEYSFSKISDSATRKVICALAQFSEFAGVGYKTGMGMGACKYTY